MKIIEPLLVITSAVFGFLSVVYIFYSFAQTTHEISMVKSDKQLCEERGGVYYEQYRSSRALCLDKGALK
jgi:hypothetical protein